MTNEPNYSKELLEYSTSLNVLYVEDDEALRQEWKRLLQRFFKNVYVAGDGEIGLELFGEYHVDLVITDILMPNLNGLEMAKEIKTANGQLPVIVNTAFNEEHYLLEAIEVGIDAFLPKPTDLRLLTQTLLRICKNIVNQKAAADGLQYFNALTESSIVSKSDLEGNITYVNDNLCAVSGYTREELLGQSHRIFRHPGNPDALYKNLWETVLSGKIWRERVTNLNKNGSSFLADTIIIPLKDDHGGLKEFIAIRQDVTDLVMMKRKMQENAIRREEERKIAEAKEGFLVLFTHELKTPLNAIINFSKYIRKQLDKPRDLDRDKIGNLLESIINNGTDMLENITNILDISKLKANKLTYNYTTFSANTLLESQLERLGSLLDAKGAHAEIRAPQECMISSDEHRVKQVVANILSNAIKYGHDRIVATLGYEGDSVVLAIEDNGKGITDKEGVFRLYDQGEESLLQRKSEGTGVGLYFVKLLCDDLGIGYRLEDSAELGGVRFVFTFTPSRRSANAT